MNRGEDDSCAVCGAVVDAMDSYFSLDDGKDDPHLCEKHMKLVCQMVRGWIRSAKKTHR